MATVGVLASAVGALAAIGWIVVWTTGLGAVAGELERELYAPPDDVEQEIDEGFDEDVDLEA